LRRVANVERSADPRVEGGAVTHAHRPRKADCSADRCRAQ
jgi:hypothetical protein